MAMGTMPMGGMSYTLLKCFRDRGYVRLVLLLIVRTHAPSIRFRTSFEYGEFVCSFVFRLVRERVDARTGHWALAFLLSLRIHCGGRVSLLQYLNTGTPHQPTKCLPREYLSTLGPRSQSGPAAAGRGGVWFACHVCVRGMGGGVAGMLSCPGASARDAAAERGGRRRRGRPVVGA